MAKEITDLVEATVLNDADLILARQGSEDKKALISTLIDKVNLGLPVADSSNKGIVDKELILQLLLLVDGTGSGLDSDLLDGEQGSFYQNADNLNAGTVPTNRLPSASTTVKGIIQQATTVEAEGGVIGKFPDAAGVLAAISANVGEYITSQGSNANGHYRTWSNGTIEQWGTAAAVSSTVDTKPYPIPFVSGCDSLIISDNNASPLTTGSLPFIPITYRKDLISYEILLNPSSGSPTPSANQYNWYAIGS